MVCSSLGSSAARRLHDDGELITSRANSLGSSLRRRPVMMVWCLRGRVVDIPGCKLTD